MSENPRLPKLMGIVNATPDSFFDGGRHLGMSRSQERVDALIAEGADIVDIGGESTRPGAEPVSADEQLRRIEPALKRALARGVQVSVDTSSPRVAAHALALGAQIVNDVSCLREPELARVVAEHGATLILMHSREAMRMMQGFSRYPEDGYTDVVREVRDEWRRARDRALEAGIAAGKVWLDPGLGFNKSARHSLMLLARLDEFLAEGVPIVLGASRKSFIAGVDGPPPERRLGGSIAACLWATKLGASVLRIHDVEPTLQALRLNAALAASVREVPHA